MNVSATYTASDGTVEGPVVIIDMTTNGRDTNIVYIDSSGNLKRDTKTIPATATSLPVTYAIGASHN